MANLRRSFIIYLFVVVVAIYSLFPLYTLFNVSLETPRQLFQGTLFPVHPTLTEFLSIFGYGNSYGLSSTLLQGLKNSIIVGFSVMAITMLACVPAGYALGRFRMRGRMGLVFFLLFSRTLPPVSVVLPFFYFFSKVGLKGTILGLTIVQLSITIPIVTWILMGFFGALPVDIENQARADGCSRYQAFRHALLPLAAPGIAASAVIAFLFSWNDFFYSFVITSGSSAATYNVFLDALLGTSTGSISQPTVIAAAVVIQILVAIVVAGFLQKYITSLKILDPGTVVG